MKPVKGLRFNHSRVLSSEAFDGKTPQLYEVTRIAMGMVYYRPVYAVGLAEERLGGADCCPTEDFHKYANCVTCNGVHEEPDNHCIPIWPAK